MSCIHWALLRLVNSLHVITFRSSITATNVREAQRRRYVKVLDFLKVLYTRVFMQ